MNFQTMADSAIFGIVLGILCALPILILATRNVIIGFFATFSMCCTTVCVIGVIPLAGWKLGVSVYCFRQVNTIKGSKFLQPILNE